MDLKAQVMGYWEACYPAVYVHSAEETRVEDILTAVVADMAERPAVKKKGVVPALLRWTITKGWHDVEGAALDLQNGRLVKAAAGGPKTDSKDSRVALEMMAGFPEFTIACLKDFHPFMEDPVALRQIRDLAAAYKGTTCRMAVFLSPCYPAARGRDASAGLPAEIAKSVTPIDFALPTQDELGRVLDDLISKNPAVKAPTEAAREPLLVAGSGMTTIEFENSAALAWLRHKSFEGKEPVATVYAEKAAVIKQGGALECILSSGQKMSDVGGLDLLKSFFRARERAFTKEARAFGVDTPKGVMLVGEPGCLHGETPIYDPVDGTTKPVRERYAAAQEFHVLSLAAMPSGGVVVVAAKAERPRIYPTSSMVRLTAAGGQEMTVTYGHRFWSGDGWLTASEVVARLRESERVLLPTSEVGALSIQPEGAVHSTGRPGGCAGGCRCGSHCDDAQLRIAAGAVRAFVRQSADAPEYIHDGWCRDGREGGTAHIHACRGAAPLSMPNSGGQRDGCCVPERRNAGASGQSASTRFESEGQSPETIVRHGTTPIPAGRAAASRRGEDVAVEPARRPGSFPHMPGEDGGGCLLHQGPSRHGGRWSASAAPQFSEEGRIDTGRPPASVVPGSNGDVAAWASPPLCVTGNYSTRYEEIIKAENVEPAEYYDFHVPVYENYWACGLWHHNTGKTLSGKAVSAMMGLPMLKMDPGSLFGSYVGESERNTRDALRTAEAMAPCVLLIDEIEKGIGMATAQGLTDSGVSSRVVATILTWLQERQRPVYVIATANRVEKIPPELMRAGRFDAVFYVALPAPEEREEIFQIHLRKKGRSGLAWVAEPVKKCPCPPLAGRGGGHAQAASGLEELAQHTDGFSGAEIEQVVARGLLRAFCDGGRELQLVDLVREADALVPLSTTAAEQIEATRHWLAGRAQPASSIAPALEPPKRGGRKIGPEN